jgi:hypothetical protein
MKFCLKYFLEIYILSLEDESQKGGNPKLFLKKIK